MVTKKLSLLNISNIVAFVAVLIVNGLAGGTTLIGGKVTGEISDANYTLVTPAGFTFSIWSVIYVLLGLFVIYQALPRERTKGFQGRIGWLFVASSVFNILWLFAWQYEVLIASVAIMILLLASLIAIYLRLDIGRRRVKWDEAVAVHLPFSVYLGWITIATIANISATLVSIGWDGFGLSPETWAVVIILMATAIASLVAIRRKDIAYELVIIWAFYGIAVEHISEPVIPALLFVCAIVVVAVLITSIYLSRVRPQWRRAGKAPR